MLYLRSKSLISISTPPEQKNPVVRLGIYNKKAVI